MKISHWIHDINSLIKPKVLPSFGGQMALNSLHLPLTKIKTNQETHSGWMASPCSRVSFELNIDGLALQF